MKRKLGILGTYDYIVVGSALVLAYFTLSITLGYIQNIHQTMFWASDSRSYRAVGEWLLSLGHRDPTRWCQDVKPVGCTNWLSGLGSSDATLVRPFFYPFIIVLAHTLGGVYGIWVVQFVLWLASGILLYSLLKKVSRNIFITFCGTFLFAGNLTLIILTFHALTEVLTTFLLSVLAALIVNKKSFSEEKFWLFVIFVASLLTVTKPVYMILLLITLSYQPIRLLWTRKRPNPRSIMYLFLALSPVLFQIGIMKARHNLFSISKIGSFTTKYYYASRVYGKVEGMSVREARMSVRSFSMRDIFAYLIHNSQVSLSIYLEDIKENILTKSNFIDPKKHLISFYYMKALNKIYYQLHLVMLPLVFILSVILIIKYKQNKYFRERLEQILYLLFPFLLTLMTSGITFWQGDRIILPSLPLWIILYTLTLSTYWDLYRLSYDTV